MITKVNVTDRTENFGNKNLTIVLKIDLELGD